MSYRGRDLDLRTPERPHSIYEQRPAEQGMGTAEPVLVDEAVLACCNHGYDLALAHRAREVRIEHLLNAMTRTDAAVAVLAVHGVDVAGLRHDTASLIAADEAIIPGNERMAPRRSQLLADVLHFASDRARQRQSAVSVSDLLRTLFELNSEQSGVVMLKRNAPGWQPRNSNEPLRSEPLPPLLGGGYQVDTRYAPPEAREWVRVATPQPGYYQAPQSGYFVPEPAAAPQAYYPAEPAVAGGSVTDVVQNSRLDQLERTIRELSGELVAERKALNQLVGERKREAPLAGEIEPMIAHGRVDPADRLSALERSVEAKFADLARGWTVLGERLQGLEQAVNGGGGIDHQQGFEQMSATLSTLVDRLQGLERQIAKSAAGSIDFDPITERLMAIEQAQTLRPTATAAALAPVIDRLTAIERLQSNRPAATVDLAPVLERLQAIEGRMGEVNRGSGGFVERIGQFERKLDSGLGASERTANQIAERVRAIEEAMIAQRNQVAQLATNVSADIKALGQTVGQQGTSGERLHSQFGDRIQTLTSAVEKSRAEISASVALPLVERMGQVSKLVESHRAETTQVVSDMGERIGALEKVIQGFGQRTLDLHAAHGADLVELHNALVKLNGNQQTLAGSMDQWRLDNGNELSALLTRLDGVERSSVKPMQMLESLQSNVQSLQRSTAKREEQRSRFRHWLMGTDDWYGASWEHDNGAISPAKGTAGPAVRG